MDNIEHEELDNETELEIEIDDPELGHAKGDEIDEVIDEYERLTEEM